MTRPLEVIQSDDESVDGI